ncbi:MAG TPA: CHAT domain-containing protein [Thermoanaerobaculia bacterium]
MIALVLAATLAQRAVDLTNEWKLDEAESVARAAMSEAIACDDLDERALAADALGIVARMRGNADLALDYATEAVELAQRNSTRARTLVGLARIEYELLDRTSDARAHLQQSLAVEVTPRALLNLGIIAMNERDLREAEELFARAATFSSEPLVALAAEHDLGFVKLLQHEPAQALAHFQKALAYDRGAQRARILLAMSEAHRARGELSRATAVLRDAAEAARRSGDERARATILLREGDLALERGAFAAAEQAFARSESLGARLHDRAHVALARAYRAKLRLRQHRFDDAVALAKLAARDGDADTIAQAHAIAGNAHRQRGRLVSARRELDAAIDAIERQRTRASADVEVRQRFFERETDPYLAAMEVALAQHDAAAALAYADRAKARMLRDVAPPSRAAFKPEAGEVLVEYAASGDALFAFTRTSSGVRGVRINASRASVAALIEQLARELAQRNLRFRATAASLHALLLAPLALDAGQRIIVVPDQELWRVPFHALVDAHGRYVVEHSSVAYAPSLALLARATPRTYEHVFVAASLEGAQREIETIGQVWGSTRATLVANASEAAVRNAAARSDIIHIAAHGAYDEADPMQSYLALYGGRLTARELARLRLRAPLVILSACQTAAGRPAAGEGIVGMPWALLLAGAEEAVVSQWDVDSASTATLMIDFHRAVASGASPAAALRTAQLNMLRRHPFYWAAFVVIGRRF